MALAVMLRNLLIVGGVAGGVALTVRGAIAELPAADHAGQAAPQPVTLNTARPPALPPAPLQNPLSLESVYGRGELTGQAVRRVPADPLEEVNLDRRWDVTLELPPPRVDNDLPAAKAGDEVAEPVATGASQDEFDLSDLPEAAKAAAASGQDCLRQGMTLLRDGREMVQRMGSDNDRREGQKKLEDATQMLEDARDHFRRALQLAPNHAALLALLQEAKAGIYSVTKFRVK